MPNRRNKLAFGSGSSVVVTRCQVCGSTKLEPILFLGYLPPVNTLHQIGSIPREQPSYPAQLLFCPTCTLVQIGIIVDPKILFPYSYPYTSSTTRILRENFAELYQECSRLLPLKSSDLVIDIGSNDGNLLDNFKDRCRVLGITPEKIGKEAIKRGVPTMIEYFNEKTAKRVRSKYGNATLITATNVFAHIENINDITKHIVSLLKPEGVFISESHYLYALLQTLQYDTIYHEHLRYYSLHSLKYLLEKHGLEIFHAKQIPTHGGSIRVYAARKGKQKIHPSVQKILNIEKNSVTKLESLLHFAHAVVLSKLKLHSLLYAIKQRGQQIYGISAPSRATTLINYVGIDDGILDCVVEIKGSHKIGHYVPGTRIPIVDEQRLFENQPDVALLLSWHIAEELIPKLKAHGYKGQFLIPLPTPRLVR